MFGLAVLSSIAVATAAPADTPIQYQEGQTWEYQTRPEDTGSLLRIQKVEENPAFAKYGPIYHISVIGVRFRDAPLSGDLPHLPVSRETLDASVTRLSYSSVTFPAADPGIAEWRSAHGGVFTIPLADIISSVEQMFKHGSPRPAAPIHS
jgi:hypothetical protein